MLSAKIYGAIILGLPLVIIAWMVLWRRHRAVFGFALALIAAALGYLMATGATDDIARYLIPDLAGPPPVRAQ
jgi:hypothetical protein